MKKYSFIQTSRGNMNSSDEKDSIVMKENELIKILPFIKKKHGWNRLEDRFFVHCR